MNTTAAPATRAGQIFQAQRETVEHFRHAMKNHIDGYRMHVNKLETFLGHAAKCEDGPTQQHLPEANAEIAAMRTALSALEHQWKDFNGDLAPITL
jgi:hypothetical protein